MISPDVVAAAVARAKAQLGKPYLLDAKWEINDENPVGPVDCSGFSKWVLAPCGNTLPDGSYNQIKVCTKLDGAQLTSPPPLCLGFFEQTVIVDHVIVVQDEENVIEARGEPYNAVINRPIAKWLAQAGFLGFYAPPGLL
jgi:cell wall-associated NlpC family hydrolase